MFITDPLHVLLIFLPSINKLYVSVNVIVIAIVIDTVIVINIIGNSKRTSYRLIWSVVSRVFVVTNHYL